MTEQVEKKPKKKRGPKFQPKKPFRGFLYDKGVMVAEIPLEDPPGHLEFVKWRRAYRVNSDDPHMPTEAMAEFIRLGCCRVPFPQPKMPPKHKTRQMLNEYRDYVLAEAAFDDFQDAYALQANSDPKEVLMHLIDVMYSRIRMNAQVAEELKRFIAKHSDQEEAVSE